MSRFRIFSSYVKLNNDAFRLRVCYEPVGTPYMYRYSIKCIDSQNLTLILIDSNVIDEKCEISLEDALAKTKYYLNDRFGYEIVKVEIVPEEIQEFDSQSKTYKTVSRDEYERAITR